ncbi:VOC family protein [Candidatus Thorarchaeota archaeon]|nr:MAG: VOC family protein [Candidatus Thorarchaeota archaeon]
MPGIFFFKTKMLENLTKFYTERVGMDIWLEQPDCTILRKDNLLLGFCQRNQYETDGMLTFFFETTEEVDAVYSQLVDIALTQPKENRKYNIYQFFAEDPEGRALEFQAFLHDIKPL